MKMIENVMEAILLRHHFQIHTSLPKKRIHRWIELFVREYWDDCVGWLEDDGFIIRVKSHGRNTEAPILKAKIIEKEDGSVIDATLGVTKSSQIMLVSLQLFLLYAVFVDYFAILLFLILIGMNFISVFLPARKLQKRLITYFEQETIKTQTTDKESL